MHIIHLIERRYPEKAPGNYTNTFYRIHQRTGNRNWVVNPKIGNLLSVY